MTLTFNILLYVSFIAMKKSQRFVDLSVTLLDSMDDVALYAARSRLWEPYHSLRRLAILSRRS